MAFNIMDLVKDHITPDNIGAIAGMLGEDEKKTAGGISGAIPAILGGLIGAVSKPEGEKAFGQAIEQADTGLVGNLMGALGGGGGSSLVSSGVKLLGSFFGDNKLTSLVGAIAGFSGLSSGSSKSLLGLAAPFVMSMLAKKGKDDGLDSKGLIGMLLGQKDNVAKAMPPALGQSLRGLGLLDDPAARATPPPVAPARAPEPVRAEPEPKKGGSLLGKLLLLAVLALAAWLAYQFLMQPRSAQTPMGTVIEEEAVVVTEVDAGMALSDEVGALISQAGQTLAGVTSVEAAEELLPQLESIGLRLSQVAELATSLTPEQRQTVAATAAQLMPALQNNAESVSAVPGAMDVVGPTVDALMSAVDRLAGD